MTLIEIETELEQIAEQGRELEASRKRYRNYDKAQLIAACKELGVQVKLTAKKEVLLNALLIYVDGCMHELDEHATALQVERKVARAEGEPVTAPLATNIGQFLFALGAYAVQFVDVPAVEADAILAYCTATHNLEAWQGSHPVAGYRAHDISATPLVDGPTWQAQKLVDGQWLRLASHIVYSDGSGYSITPYCFSDEQGTLAFIESIKTALPQEIVDGWVIMEALNAEPPAEQQLAREWYFYWEDAQGERWEYGPYFYEDATDEKHFYEVLNPEKTYYLEQRHVQHQEQLQHLALEESLVGCPICNTGWTVDDLIKCDTCTRYVCPECIVEVHGEHEWSCKACHDEVRREQAELEVYAAMGTPTPESAYVAIWLGGFLRALAMDASTQVSSVDCSTLEDRVNYLIAVDAHNNWQASIKER